MAVRVNSFSNISCRASKTACLCKARDLKKSADRGRRDEARHLHLAVSGFDKLYPLEDVIRSSSQVSSSRRHEIARPTREASSTSAALASLVRLVSRSSGH